jgi:acyl-CoA reductase-like NAD-dependent aldehyde dehydrogenase
MSEFSTVDIAVRESHLQGGWSRLSANTRLQVLTRIRDAIVDDAEILAEVEAKESGKFRNSAIDDVNGCIELWSYALELLTNEINDPLLRHRFGNNQTALEIKRPVGPVLMITPFNYPLIVLSERLPFALAAGCPVIVKPSETTPSSAVRLSAIARECGLPSGAFQVVPGDGFTGARLAADKRFAMISFTGSTAVAKQISDGIDHRQTRTSFELGGKNSFVVSQTADLDAAAKSAAFASTINGGQACIAPSRMIIHQDIYHEFLALLKTELAGIVEQNLELHGLPIQQPLQGRHLTRAISALAEIRSQHHWRELFDPELLSSKFDLRKFVLPRVFEVSGIPGALFCEEFFVPYLTASQFTSLDEAIDLANYGEYGLAAYLWSTSEEELYQLTTSVRAGRQWVNCDMRSFSPRVAIGGFGLSGIGRELGPTALDWYRLPVGITRRS